MSLQEMFEKLNGLERLIIQSQVYQKEFLSFSEALVYLDMSESNLYKLTHTNKIPFYKPNGKKLYFRKSELNDWIVKFRYSAASEVAENAANFLDDMNSVANH